MAFFAGLVAFGLGSERNPVSLAAGVALCVVCIALGGMLRRRWAYGAGWLVQVLLIAGGVFVPAMYVMGVLFAVLWIVALRLGGRIDRERVEREDLELAYEMGTVPNQADTVAPAEGDIDHHEGDHAP